MINQVQHLCEQVFVSKERCTNDWNSRYRQKERNKQKNFIDENFTWYFSNFLSFYILIRQSRVCRQTNNKKKIFKPITNKFQADETIHSNFCLFNTKIELFNVIWWLHSDLRVKKNAHILILSGKHFMQFVLEE